MKRRLRRITIALVSASIALLVMEAGYRILLKWRGSPYSATAVTQRLGALVDTMAAYTPATAEDEERKRPTKWLHPYYGSENYPDTGSVLRNFAKGFSDDEYTVVVVGGSVAAAWALDSASFVERLRADPRLQGKQIRMQQYAHAAYKQPQQVMRMAYMFSLGFVPDAVINLDGFNESANAYHQAIKGIHPVYPSGETWGGLVHVLRDFDDRALRLYVELDALRQEAETVARTASRWGFAHSSILGQFTLSRMLAINSRRASVQGRLISLPNPAGYRDPQASGLEFDDSFESVMGIVADNWFESSISLDALCQARGVYYLHCLQPTLLDPGAKPVSDVERGLPDGANGWREGVVGGYPRLREAGETLLARGVHFIDISRFLSDVEQTVYIDACHFNALGNELLGAEIASAFLDGLSR